MSSGLELADAIDEIQSLRDENEALCLLVVGLRAKLNSESGQKENLRVALCACGVLAEGLFTPPKENP